MATNGGTSPVEYLIQGLSEWRPLDPSANDAQPGASAERLSAYLLSSLQMPNLSVLTGLGTSIEVGGPTMPMLWELCVGSPPEGDAAAVIQALNYDASGRNIEELLSRCDAQLQGSGDISGISTFRTKCIARIVQRCRDVGTTAHSLDSHRDFIRRLARRRSRDPRLRLFTTNYDLCFERAAGLLGLTAVDGFSFSSPRRFDPRFFEYDLVRRGSAIDTPEYVAGVFQYLKIHGSVDWEIGDTGEVTVSGAVDPSRACLIYPTRQKFQFSFQQPHLELMAQFMSSLRQSNTCLLIVGFGFNDSHLTEPILSALDTNPHLRVLVVSPNADGHFKGANGPWKRLRQSFERGDDIGFVKSTFLNFVPLIPDLKALTAGERIERDIRAAVRGNG